MTRRRIIGFALFALAVGAMVATNSLFLTFVPALIGSLIVWPIKSFAARESGGSGTVQGVQVIAHPPRHHRAAGELA